MRNRPLISLVLVLSGCMKWVPVEVPAPANDTARVAGWNQVRLRMPDGQELVLRHAVAKGDSIRGLLAANEPSFPDSMVPVAVATATITRIDVRRTDAVRSVVLVGALAGTAALLASVKGMGSAGSVRIPCGLLGEPCPP